MYSYLELENKSFEDFYLKFCGMQECKPNYSYGPAVRPNYLLHYCLSGQGEYHVNNQVYQIKAGDAFLIMNLGHIYGSALMVLKLVNI